MKSSKRDKIEGKAQQGKGKIKEAAGVLTGDRSLEAEGEVDQAEGKLQEKVGQVKEAFGK